MYIPVYHSYIDGCVVGTANGTLLTNNLYSVAYNYAAQDGNDAFISGMDDYNTEKSDLCSLYTASTQEQYNEDAVSLHTYVSNHRAARDDVYLLDQCINVSSMDAMFTEVMAIPSQCVCNLRTLC